MDWHQYYKIREQDHRLLAHRTLNIGATGAALATVSSILVSMSSESAAIDALAVAGAAIGAYAIGHEQMTQDRRNAERYRRTAMTLTSIAKQMDAVREAAAKENGEAVFAFIATINEHVSLEHRQWLETADSEKEVLTRLSAALGQADQSKATEAVQAKGQRQ